MVHTHGWVRRKVKNSDKWVRRWLEVNKHVLYSYQSCPADMPSARVMNMLDLRKTRTIDVVDGEEGLFVIVPQSADDAHPGYLMKAESRESALAWVAGLNAARDREIEKSGISATRRSEQLPSLYAKVAQAAGSRVRSFDLGSVAQMCPVDGVHLQRESQIVVAEALAEVCFDMLVHR